MHVPHINFGESTELLFAECDNKQSRHASVHWWSDGSVLCALYGCCWCTSTFSRGFSQMRGTIWSQCFLAVPSGRGTPVSASVPFLLLFSASVKASVSCMSAGVRREKRVAGQRACSVHETGSTGFSLGFFSSRGEQNDLQSELCRLA